MFSTCPSHRVLDPTVCQTCAMIAGQRRARRRGIGIAIGLALPVAGAVTYLSTRPKHVPPPPPRVQSELEQDMRARLVREPCSVETNLNLVQHLAEQDLIEEALEVGNRSLGRCGVLGEMDWRVSGLHKLRHQWIEAAIETTGFIDDNPRDPDFWWWRGEAWAAADHPWLAVSDFRQSLASSDGERGQVATEGLGPPAAATGDRCEGARAWRYNVTTLGHEMTQSARDEYTSLVRAGTCAGDDGTGRARYRIDAMTGLGTAKVTVGAATGTFKVDPAAGTTLVSRAFAARAGLSSSSVERGSTVYGGAVVMGNPARIARLDAGGAVAGNVDVLISDELGSEDGVLGLSFLWHFDVTVDAGAVTVSPPRAVTAAR